MLTERIERLDFEDADIYMHCTSEIERTLRVNACAKEPETVEWIRSFPEDSLFWDVGANVGSYSLIAASLGHSVVAFEPSLVNAARLQANALLNGLWIRVVPVALGSIAGAIEFPVTTLEPGATHGLRYEGDATVSAFSVPAALLSRACGYAPPDYMKVDVDGSELGVLEGCEDYLPRYGLLVEVSDDTSVPVCKLLEGQRFVLDGSYPRSEPGVTNLVFRR